MSQTHENLQYRRRARSSGGAWTSSEIEVEKEMVTTSTTHRKYPLLLSMLVLIVGVGLWFKIQDSSNAQTSENWAGYVWPSTSGVTMVSASWTVPTLNCRVPPNAFSTAWVGVGGFSRVATWPFPQTGTDSSCANGVQVNDYWCSHKTFKEFGVSPGDVMEAKIYETRGRWFCSVEDATTKRSDVKELDYAYSGTTNVSEWIVESTTISSKSKSEIGKLADFGSLTFSDMNMSPGRWKSVDKDPRNDVAMTNANGQVIASPSWSAGGMTIVYK